jgi:hypothetical protein
MQGNPFQLGLMPVEEAHALIIRPAEAVGVRFPPELVRTIHDLAGGHPFLIQVACYHALSLLSYSHAERCNAPLARRNPPNGLGSYVPVRFNALPVSDDGFNHRRGEALAGGCVPIN